MIISMAKILITRVFFERFYREDTSHSSEKAGYGIGLSIAEELVKLLKGTNKSQL